MAVYRDEYGNIITTRKKKKEEDDPTQANSGNQPKSNAPSNRTWYGRDENGNLITIQPKSTSEDIAPVRTDVPGSADYERKAQEGLSAYHQKKTEAIEKEKSESGLWKFLKNMALAGLNANDNPTVMSVNQQALVYRQYTSYK